MSFFLRFVSAYGVNTSRITGEVVHDKLQVAVNDVSPGRLKSTLTLNTAPLAILPRNRHGTTLERCMGFPSW